MNRRLVERRGRLRETLWPERSPEHARRATAAEIEEVFVAQADLEPLAEIARRSSGGASALRGFLERAIVVEPDEASRIFVGLFSHVTYDDTPGRKQRRIQIVPPENANNADRRVAVTTALGLTLLGRRPGEYLRLGARAGYPRMLLVRDVEQPDGRNRGG